LKDPAIVKALCPDWREVTRAVQRLAAMNRVAIIFFVLISALFPKLPGMPYYSNEALNDATDHCPNYDGSLKIIAAIEDPPVIVRILTHLGLSTRASPRSLARRFDLFQTA
jgi:hypothetical protein